MARTLAETFAVQLLGNLPSIRIGFPARLRVGRRVLIGNGGNGSCPIQTAVQLNFPKPR